MIKETSGEEWGGIEQKEDNWERRKMIPKQSRQFKEKIYYIWNKKKTIKRTIKNKKEF